MHIRSYKTLIHLTFYTLLLSLSGLLLACTSSAIGPPPEPVSVRLKWLHQTQFAGLYMADQEGYYAAEQLQVRLDPVDFEQSSAIDQVLAGQNDFGISAAEDIIIARSQDKPVRAIAVIYRINPGILLIKPDSGIQSPQDFLGRKVALAPDGSPVYKAMMKRLGLDRSQVEEIIYPGFDLWECWDLAPVCPNYATNGPVLLQQAGQPFSLIWPSDYGVDWYGDVLFTSDHMIAENPDRVARFVRASLRGWQHAIEAPDLAVTAALAYNPELDETFQRQALRASIPLIDSGRLPLGYMEAQVWQSVHDILLEQDLMATPLDVDQIYTNEFVEKAE